MCPSIYSVFPAFHSFISSLFEFLFPFTFYPSISSLSKYLFPPTFFLCNYPSLFYAPIYLCFHLSAFFHPSFFLFSIVRPCIFHSSFHSSFFLNSLSLYPSIYPFIMRSSLVHSIHPPSLHTSTRPFLSSPLSLHPFIRPLFLPFPPSILSSRHPRSIPGGSHLISRGRPKEKRV